jgi:hypothetical protein
LHQLVSIPGLVAQTVAKSAQSGECGKHVRTNVPVNRHLCCHFDPNNVAWPNLFQRIIPDFFDIAGAISLHAGCRVENDPAGYGNSWAA